MTKTNSFTSDLRKHKERISLKISKGDRQGGGVLCGGFLQKLTSYMTLVWLVQRVPWSLDIEKGSLTMVT